MKNVVKQLQLRKESVNLKISKQTLSKLNMKRKKVKIKKNKRQYIQELWDIKQFNIPIIEVPAREEMKQTKYSKRKQLRIL